MRRRRQGLQVSTFPFLAVLLCAMGSLILLLLVLDRRAKVVARSKAMEAITRKTERAAELAARELREWEDRRDLLRSQLQDQISTLEAQAQDLKGKQQEVATQLRFREESVKSLQAREQEEKSLLAGAMTGLAAHQAEVQKRHEMSTAATAELNRLTRDLVQLEETLAQLKEARRRQAQTFSLVPYRGKRGDSRKPLYVECRTDAIVFHPEQVEVQGSDLEPVAIAREIAKRVPQAETKLTGGGAPSGGTYLLFLVRPDGIMTYYRVLTALQGQELDYGYEFIDADWILDFAEDSKSFQPQEWMAAKPQLGIPMASTQKSERARSAGTMAQGQKTGPPWNGVGQSGSSSAGGSTEYGVPGSGFELPAMPGSAAQQGIRNAPGPGGMTGSAGTSNQPGGAADGSEATAKSLAGNSGSAVNGLPTGLLKSSDLEPGHVPGASRAEISDPPVTPGLLTGSKPALAPSGPGSSAAPESRPSSASPIAEGTTARPLASGQPSSSASPIAAGTIARPLASGQPSSSGTSGEPAGENPESGSVGRDPLEVVPANQNRKARGQPPLQLAGGRDWIITLECTADGITLYTGQRILEAELSGATGKEKGLLHVVSELIARRQASVRPGQLPFRPIVRFRVQPDGLRTYYKAYPLLEPLGLRMTRENVEPDPNAGIIIRRDR